MGTNYYWIKSTEEYKNIWPGIDFNLNDEDLENDNKTGDIHIHIGKRSAAGLYCKHCGVTICKGGFREVHFGGPDISLLFNTDNKTEDEIKRAKETYECQWCQYYYKTCPGCGRNFNNEAAKNDEEIVHICSFTWTMMAHKAIIKQLVKSNYKEPVIVNEYGDKYTAAEFLEQIDNCFIQFQDACEFW